MDDFRKQFNEAQPDNKKSCFGKFICKFNRLSYYVDIWLFSSSCFVSVENVGCERR